MCKLAVFFPGIGYTVDRPLLYFSRQLAIESGYEIRLLPCHGFPQQVRGDRAKMEACFHIALSQSEEMLSDLNLSAYRDVLFIGKSVGTIVAACIAAKSAAKDLIRLVLYTPLPDTFSYPSGTAIAFTGGNDPWVGGTESRISKLCEERGVPCVLVPNANHSLETGDVPTDLETLRRVMAYTAQFIAGN